MMHQAPTAMTLAGSGPAPGEGFLSLQALTKRYHDFVAVDAVDLDVSKGEFVALLGPSGCGKTTTLRMIAGLAPATAGRIVVAGRDLTRVPPHRRDMGLVFQSYALFPHMTVAGNVAFGLEMRGLPQAEIKARVAEAIALVRLEGREDRRPAQLSGGQQQRVALARALVIRPSILLFDEPLSNLDAKLREEMRAEIRDIQRRLGTTAVFVTHDQDEALTMSDRVVVMSHGRIEQVGTPEDLYERPASPFVAAFVGRTNRFPGIARGTTVTAGALALAAPAPHEGAVDVMVRPHRIQIEPAGLPAQAGMNHAAGTVRRTIYAGNVVQYEVEAAGLIFTVEQATRGSGGLAPAGTPVTLAWAVADTLVFGAAP
ncbi:ABC transporter ATP-binding protein [Prosthecomicrobium sp. N25]|uniref:ABC transporter ATP-binding protein n=1 Tax=Prosthecomicrobium sp. N25 TaxID=3129254 RepID=UPI003076D870